MSQPGPSETSSTRRVRIPSRFRSDSTDSSESEQSDTVCQQCHQREPPGCDDMNVFWIDW